MQVLKSDGARMQPYLTPVLTGKKRDTPPSDLTALSIQEYRLVKQFAMPFWNSQAASFPQLNSGRRSTSTRSARLGIKVSTLLVSLTSLETRPTF